MHTQIHTNTHKADIARMWCLASQPEIFDTFKKVRGALHQSFVGRFNLQTRMLWESICGRECCELSCTARTHGLGLRGEGGGESEAGGVRVKKSRAWGLVGGLVHIFLSPLFLLFFLVRMLRSVDIDGISADKAQGARLVFSSACIVCIISSRCSTKAKINYYKRLYMEKWELVISHLIS